MNPFKIIFREENNPKAVMIMDNPPYSAFHVGETVVLVGVYYKIREVRHEFNVSSQIVINMKRM